ncbi:16S rRNA (adenine(1518)-N(6)/adenine(1519)-N(6))-dimethyltransferase RsmA [Accumulibacter sp.]|uniref:16S rRNA (adenine(1518)-N(6)/adenine(1519)-N(6))- dimethyltransferase RsmA n=1 Tax=Accumulibacter sp. TaxID=2053492 RepID=UPI0025F136AB|nr:16S rRNA (adenine(1518)-N(6)/adenine(1519)-N(6))-dimethyltransferase RsmA [Accumulibacter sp.]MCM8595426.1 16S rRNA (adenine(1518)-N(6)/adenine(1519)-N(6))-dimethyltransferase RsmA [Accumulibacter sp.]MCM8626393.1 16S rRNA (adenine(1518)-N(6)/adenine(1519)-N(6))-dimethyltransferase RsmA [Accumulibacter sp.]MDS4049573.1 16S rRNA (adenine(1518)-N(6)/adenine(1519)-N(6))-dimethyltransferase RsmA [Accumulibacter sp.]
MREHVPRKRFGQHFLIDARVVDEILSCLSLRGDDLVVEVGPGLGALTGPLLRSVEHLHVVEIDRDIVARLRQRYAADRLTIHAGDALLFDFRRVAGDAVRALRIVGNLPYNISTPLLFHLLDSAECIRDMHFMLQREVVDRMVADPATRDYGRLSVMLQRHFVIERVLDVPPEAFSPRPKVHSAVVRLLPRGLERESATDGERFAIVVRAAFAQRRKTLRNSLGGLIDEHRLASLGISPTCRAEELSVEDYVRLARDSAR